MKIKHVIISLILFSFSCNHSDEVIQEELEEQVITEEEEYIVLTGPIHSAKIYWVGHSLISGNDQSGWFKKLDSSNGRFCFKHWKILFI